MDENMLIFLAICYIMANCFEVQSRILTKEEDLALEKQLRTLNKPFVATIKTEYGDIYDCVDFYKQPAFDHPLLKNHTFHPQMSYKHENMGNNASNSTNEHIFEPFKGGGCPIGNVPIKRITKEDLIREKEYLSKFNISLQANQATDVAIVQTRPENKGPFTGAGMIAGIYKPGVYIAPQYSAVRLRIQNGNDAIQIGWRVDPSLYGDYQIRLYSYFKAGQTECFNTRCSGFVYVRRDYPLDYVFKNYYRRWEKTMHETKFNIARDNVGNWWLEVGPQNIQLGFWPGSIFSELNSMATYIDWGAEVLNIPYNSFVQMGLGAFPNLRVEETAFCRVLAVLTPDGKTSDPPPTQPYYNRADKYRILDYPHADDYYRHAVFYGGPN